MDSISPASYTQVQHISVILGREQVELITKPGLPEWDFYSPSTNVFIEHAEIKPDATILLFGCHLGVLAAYLARRFPQTRLFITDQLYTSLEMTRLTLEANQAESVNILSETAIPERLVNSFNTIFVQIPKGRLLARRWLIQAHRALIKGGKLYLGGSNKAGIQSVIKDGCELFGNGYVLGYKKGNRVALFTKLTEGVPDAEWVVSPGIAPGTWFEFTINFHNQHYHIRSLPGVFSYNHLDEGTQMLLNSVKIPPGGSVLDVGCGYGIVGLYAARQGAGNVDLVDNNLLATASCSATLALNGGSNAQVFAGDLLDPVSNNEYDLILSNPPFHAGHQVDFQIAEALIAQSQLALSPGGMLIIVANRFIRYDNLIKAIFGNVTLMNESGKYHVLSGLKSR